MKLKLKLSLLVILMILSIPVIYSQKKSDSTEILRGIDPKYQSILSSGELRVGVATDYPPLRYKKNDKQFGFEEDFMRALADFLQVKLVQKPVSTQTYLSAILDNEVDIIIAGMSQSLLRGKAIWFSLPYLEIEIAALVDKRVLPQTKFGDTFEEIPFKTIHDLKKINDFRFAVKRKSIYEDFVAANFSDFKSILVENNQEAYNLLIENEVHGFIHDSIYLEYLYNKNNLRNRFLILKSQRQAEFLTVGLPFGAVILKNQIDLFISEMKRSGKISFWLTKASE